MRIIDARTKVMLPIELLCRKFSFSLNVALFLLLTSCGFQPLLGQSAGAADELSKIQVLQINDRSGQILRNNLMNDFAQPLESTSAGYTLVVRLEEPRQEIAIRRDESASRVGYTANATFVLRDVGGRSLLTGTSFSTSTYEATNSEFASVTAQRSARDRALQQISADIRQQIAAYFVRLKAQPAVSR
jgi:hypothetical protein